MWPPRIHWLSLNMPLGNIFLNTGDSMEIDLLDAVMYHFCKHHRYSILVPFPHSSISIKEIFANLYASILNWILGNSWFRNFVFLMNYLDQLYHLFASPGNQNHTAPSKLVIPSWDLKADPHELHLTPAVAAEGCVQKIENFQSQLHQCNRLPKPARVICSSCEPALRNSVIVTQMVSYDPELGNHE